MNNSYGLVDDTISTSDFILKPIVTYNENSNNLISNDYQYSLSLYRKDFVEEKDCIRFIKGCEKLVRYSPEYKDWINYLHDVLYKYICVLTKEINSETSVEIHHHPFSLYDIVHAILNKYIASNKDFCSFDLVKDVILLHYENKIGYIPLVSSLHEKYHNGCLTIPIDLVSGDWLKFKNEYLSFLDDEDVKKITNKLDITLKNCGWNNYGWSNNNYIPVQEN